MINHEVWQHWLQHFCSRPHPALRRMRSHVGPLYPGRLGEEEKGWERSKGNTQNFTPNCPKKFHSHLIYKFTHKNTKLTLKKPTK